MDFLQDKYPLINSKMLFADVKTETVMRDFQADYVIRCIFGVVKYR